jgi:predicted pyridoxine 5'-phosphate oxidase superfamily flavin-nucleotide-binding protein
MNPGFHPGEQQAQALAGVHSSAAGIRDFMPDQHRTFFAALPFVLLATVDDDGWPSAQAVSGAPGFVDSPDPVTLRVAAHADVVPGRPVGLLGLDFGTRRRNRANGSVRSAGASGFVMEVLESFGNCPQHIHLRDVHAVPAQRHPVATFAGLDPAARAIVARADTFFVATSGGAHGVDISHRGGGLGFVQVDGDTLTIPDFNGNRYFNTLGNMLIDPRAALLFIDYDSGDVLTLQGTSAIDWEQGAATPSGNEGRRWRFTTACGTLQAAALPLRWSER